MRYLPRLLDNLAIDCKEFRHNTSMSCPPLASSFLRFSARSKSLIGAKNPCSPSRDRKKVLNIETMLSQQHVSMRRHNFFPTLNKYKIR